MTKRKLGVSASRTCRRSPSRVVEAWRTPCFLPSARFRKTMNTRRWQNLNLLIDCALIVVASFVSCALPGEPGIHWRVALYMSAASMILWGVGGRVLLHYDITNGREVRGLSLIHISEPTRLLSISYAV